MNEFTQTFKFKASVLFAIISLLIVMIAGLLKDVRFITIAWRSLLAFFVAGGAAYLIIFILEFKGIINFDVMEVEEEIVEVQDKKNNKKQKKSKSKEETQAKEAKESEEAADSEEGGGFKPLNADNLERIAS